MTALIDGCGGQVPLLYVDRHPHPTHRHLWFWHCERCHRYGRWLPTKIEATDAAGAHTCVRDELTVEAA